MSRAKIADHQITGGQKLAVVRSRDRSLDSLTSSKDKRIIAEINKNADALWQEAIAKHRADKKKVVDEAAKSIAQQPRQLTDHEQDKLKILNKKEKHLLKEAVALEVVGKKKPAMNRRYQRNQILKEIKELIKGTVYDTDV